MLNRISRSAAVAMYLSIACLFILVGCIGVAEYWLWGQSLIMPVVPIYTSVTSIILGIGLLALFYEKTRLLIVCGLTLIGFVTYMVIQIWSKGTGGLVSVPLLLTLLLIGLTSACFFVPITTRLGQNLWRITASGALLGLVVMQILFWFPDVASYLQVMGDDAKTSNPNAMAIVGVSIFAGALALFLRLRLPTASRYTPKRTLTGALLFLIVGVLVWYVISAQNIRLYTQETEARIDEIATSIDERMSMNEHAFMRIQKRLESMYEPFFPQGYEDDLQRFVADFDAIDGILIFSNQDQVLLHIGKGKDYLENGYLSTDSMQTWLQSNFTGLSRAIVARSLAEEKPKMVVALPIMRDNLRHYILFFLDIREIVQVPQSIHSVPLHTFLALTPTLFLPMDGGNLTAVTDVEIAQRYQHGVAREKSILSSADPGIFYSYVADYTALFHTAQLNQMLLWFTIAFCATLIFASDNSRRLRIEKQRISDIARFDDITGLLRRDAFHDDIIAAGVCQEGSKRSNAIIFIDLDGFKPLNDSFGHEHGDRVLAEVGMRIKKSLPPSAHIARFGADEFIVHVRNTNREQLDVLAMMLIKRIRMPYLVNGFEAFVSASIGIAESEKGDMDPKQLVQLADVAMSEAKNAGGNTYRYFVDDMAENYRRTFMMRNQLQAVLDRNGLEVYYQPVIDVASGEMIGVESLVRWQQDGEFMPPALFIPIAEQSGQIIQVGEQVLHRVLKDIQNTPLLQALQVSVNVSSQQLKRYDFAHFLGSCLRNYKVNPQMLCLELTESGMFEQQKSTESLLERLRALGCQLAIDDFGTGFSNLSYLNTLPVNIIKIDRAFTRDLDANERQRTLVGNIISICKQLDQWVVVEGIETKEQVDMFTALGCDRMQGYYFARPMPLADLLNYGEHMIHSS
ncbi:MAG TPA: EAL domain-containing protein [Pseudidiomarina sp.]|nr:EAL domain-containing protein [Pseudidiomarina sp.]